MSKPITKVTRIKYNKEEGLYTSHREFLSGSGTLLNIQINTVNNTVSIMQVTTGEMYTVVETLPYKTFANAKSIAKSLLKKYGVVFYEEVRKKKATLLTTPAAS